MHCGWKSGNPPLKHIPTETGRRWLDILLWTQDHVVQRRHTPHIDVNAESMENMKATERCTEKANDQIKKDKDTRRLRGKYQRRGSVGGKLSWTSKIGRVTHGP